MSHSQAIWSRDVRQITRTIAEAIELGDDPIAWRHHLLRGVTHLVGNDAGGAVSLMPHPISVEACAQYFDVWAGTTPDQVKRWYSYLSGKGPRQHPLIAPISAMAPRKNFTRTREQLCDDKIWYGSAYFNDFRRDLHFDDLIYSQVMLPTNRHLSVIGIMRPLDSKPFTFRQRQIVHLIHSELRRLWNSKELADQPLLSRRLRQTLELICRGLSEKQTADQLSLSKPTIHNYVSMLHRRFGVQNRGELVVAGMRFFRTSGPRIFAEQALEETAAINDASLAKKTSEN